MADGVGSPVQDCPGKESGSNPPEEKKPELHWIKFKVQDESGKAIPGIVLQVVLPDGSREEKSSDDKGMVEINNVKPGNCSIDFEFDDHIVHRTLFVQ